MKLSRKKVYSLLSIITVVILSLIPGLGLFADNEFSKPHYLFGYPAKWFGYSGDFLFSFQVFNLLFNFALFYFVYAILDKLRKVLWENLLHIKNRLSNR